MKKQFIKAKEKDIIGTSFFGQIAFSFDQLEKHLGPPRDLTSFGDWKTKVEWSFKNKSKKPTVIIIYDYKELVPPREVASWHIGVKGNKKLNDFFFEYKLCQ